MKQIKTLLTLLCIVLTAASCSKESTEEAPQTPTDVAQLIKIASFPAFDEGAQTRAIGTEDPGKTTWENGDEVLLGIQFVNNEGQNVGVLQGITLTYTNGAWTADKPLDFNLPDYRATTATINAYYAPDYKWVADSGGVGLELKSGAVKGTSEYLTYTAGNVKLAEGITIDFANTTRQYSRLRIATTLDQEINVELSSFLPANGTGEGNKTTFTLTADAKGNAYLYGKWENNITVNTTDAIPVELANKTGLNTPTSGQSYVLTAYPQALNYDYRGNGNADNPYQIWNAAQLQSMNTATASNYKIFSGKYLKLINDIDCSTITEFTPIGNNTKKFAGTFDGGGHTVRNLTLGIAVSTSDVVYSGLFAYAEGATISNLILLNPRLSAKAKQSAEHIGALIGFVFATNANAITTITNCHVCLSSGSDATIESTNTERANAGGLIGQCSYTILQACSSAISVISNEKTSGGLISNGGNITLIGCRTTGAITGENAGGLAGMATKNGISIVGCYTSGALSGKYAGGFVGNSYNATALSSYCGSSENNGEYSGSFIGYNVGTFNLYYSAATSNWGTQGIGRIGNPSTTNASGEQLGCATDALYGAIITPDAEAKWKESTFDAIRAAIGNKSLSDIWVNVPGAAPRLWWEK